MTNPENWVEMSAAHQPYAQDADDVWHRRDPDEIGVGVRHDPIATFVATACGIEIDRPRVSPTTLGASLCPDCAIA